MIIYLIRHGQSEGNAGNPDASCDPPLTELGHAQAGRVALALSAEGICALYSSPMTRALQTAKAVHEVLRLPVSVRPCLAEADRGRWNGFGAKDAPASKTGLTLSEVRAQLPCARFTSDAAMDAPWWEGMANETRLEAYARAGKVLAHLRQLHPADDETIAVITHGAFGSVLMSAALDSAPSNFNRYGQYNCAISRLDYTDEGARLRYLNAVEHLPIELRTDPT